MTCILYEHQGKENVWCQNIQSLPAALLDTIFLLLPHLKPMYSSWIYFFLFLFAFFMLPSAKTYVSSSLLQSTFLQNSLQNINQATQKDEIKCNLLYSTFRGFLKKKKNSQKILKSMQLFSVPTTDPIRSLKLALKVLSCLSKLIAMVEQRWAVSAPALPLVCELLKDKKNYNNKHERVCCSCACKLQTLVWLIPIGNSSWAWW